MVVCWLSWKCVYPYPTVHSRAGQHLLLSGDPGWSLALFSPWHSSVPGLGGSWVPARPTTDPASHFPQLTWPLRDTPGLISRMFIL